MIVMRLKVKEAVRLYRNQFPKDIRPTQGQVAAAAGIDAGVLSNYVTGKIQRPDMEIISRLCTLLDITDANEIFELVEVEDETE